MIKVQRICNRLHTKYDVSSAINVAESLRAMKYSVGVWNNKEKSTGKPVQFHRREAGNSTLITERIYRYDKIVQTPGEYHERSTGI